MKRGGVDVASRKGYFAVRSAGAQPLRAYEAPAIAMLDVVPVPNAFPVLAVAVKFPEDNRLGLVPVLVPLSASNVTFVPSEEKRAAARRLHRRSCASATRPTRWCAS